MKLCCFGEYATASRAAFARLFQYGREDTAGEGPKKTKYTLPSAYTVVAFLQNIVWAK